MPDQNPTDQNDRGGCICGPCPSYSECMRGNEDFMFCVRGKTPDCMFDLKGCSCPQCTVRPAESPITSYFCAGGRSRLTR